LGHPHKRLRDLSLHHFDTIQQCDDKQTDRRLGHGKDARSILPLRVKKLCWKVKKIIMHISFA